MIKQISDPVLDSIKIKDELILKLLNTKEFRRLSNISQLGLTHFIYPGAKHDRLSHSLGTYELSRRLLDSIKEEIDEDLKLSIQISALLHDLGHGPMSHLFESISNKDHEEYTLLLIEDSESEINQLLKEYPNILDNVKKIITKTHERKFANQIISSQLDVDRLDYLLRDSYYCGTSYGVIDLEWLFKNAKIIDDELVFESKTIQTLENFLLGRYHMYLSVYNHKKNIAIQKVYELFFERIFTIIEDKHHLAKMIPALITLKEGKELSYSEFMSLDDNVFWTLIRNVDLFNDEKLTKYAHYLNHGLTPKTSLENKEGYEIVEEIVVDFNSYVDTKENQVKIVKENCICPISDISSVVEEVQDKEVMKIGIDI